MTYIFIFSNVAQLSEDQVRDALTKHVSQNCCYGKGAARGMTIKRITPSSALHVSVNSERLVKRRGEWGEGGSGGLVGENGAREDLKG